MNKNCEMFCWEFKNCGKEKNNGDLNKQTCPAGTSVYGRVCYAVAGTLCNDCVGGDFTEKYKNCKSCDYFRDCAFKEKISKKIMCWEYKKCGREIGGVHADKLGVCPASSPLEGRACWVVAGTFCQGRIHGSLANKLDDCRKCDFFQMIKAEHIMQS